MSLSNVPLLDTLSSAPVSHPSDSPISGTGQIDHSGAGRDVSISRPSIFELLAQDELRGMVQPAFRYVLAWLANHQPRYFLRIVNRHEEAYAGLMTAVEWWHLTRHNASFSEHFYGIQLSPVNPLPSSTTSTPRSRLTRKQKWSYIGCIVGIPYLRLKLNDLYQTIRIEEGSRQVEEGRGIEGHHNQRTIPRRSRKSIKRIIKRLFVLIYPYLNLIYEFTLVGYDLRYMFNPNGAEINWRPWLRILSLELIRKPPPDLPSSFITSSSPSPSILRTLRSLLLTTTTNLLPLTLLTLKALQWWYSPQSPRLTSVVTRDKLRVPMGKMILPRERGRSGLNLIREKGKGLEDMEDEEGGIDVEEQEKVAEPKEGLDDSSDEEETIHTPKGEQSETKTHNTLPYGICPICMTEWKNPTTTPTGYVGCYICLFHDVKKNGDCPITGLKMRTEDLRKVLV